MKRAESSFRDIEQQCVHRRRGSLINLIPVQLQPTFCLFFYRYERKLQRSQAKESDEDDAAGPLPVITASGKVARVERRKAPVAAAAAAAAAPVQAAPPLKELSEDQVYAHHAFLHCIFVTLGQVPEAAGSGAGRFRQEARRDRGELRFDG